jgi:hypothetical protein
MLILLSTLPANSKTANSKTANLPNPLYDLALMISTTKRQSANILEIESTKNLQAGFKLAPPTKNPSMSGCVAKSLQFFSLTEPP